MFRGGGCSHQQQQIFSAWSLPLLMKWSLCVPPSLVIEKEYFKDSIPSRMIIEQPLNPVDVFWLAEEYDYQATVLAMPTVPIFA